MRKRFTILVLTACASLAVAMVMLTISREREPVYGGRKLSEWLQLYLQPFDRFKDPLSPAGTPHITIASKDNPKYPWVLSFKAEALETNEYRVQEGQQPYD